MATWRERLRKPSGSGFVEALREDRAVKQDSRYRVTLHIILTDSAELEEREDEFVSVGSLMGSSIKAATVKPMTKVKRMIAEMVMAVETGFWAILW